MNSQNAPERVLTCGPNQQLVNDESFRPVKCEHLLVTCI